jgi:transcriptional regulator with XRE-family HTH domain
MSEGDTPPPANKIRREQLGFLESDVAALVGLSVKKIKDYESGQLQLSPAEEERIRIALESLEKKKARR